MRNTCGRNLVKPASRSHITIARHICGSCQVNVACKGPANSLPAGREQEVAQRAGNTGDGCLDEMLAMDDPLQLTRPVETSEAIEALSAPTSME